jgi:isoquinoline 1-oxidoreductase beta subunit
VNDRPDGPATGISRRQFMVASVSAGLLLGINPIGSVALAAGDSKDGLRTSVFLHIQPDGTIRINLPTTELGQGVHSALPRILADELGAIWADVEVGLAYADPGFVAEKTGRQRTAASEGVKVYFEQLRRVGASAREMLCSAAALRWSVPVVECLASDSRVRHVASGREASYGELASAASELPVPEQPVLKDIEELTLIGQSLPRKDVRDKVSGVTVFGIDVTAPNMLHAALRMPPQLSGQVLSFDAASVEKMPGVEAVVEVDGAVAVLADSFWRAKKAAEALDVKFEPGAIAGLDTPAMRDALRSSLDDDAAAVQFPDIDTQAENPKLTPLDRAVTQQALADAEQVLELEYEVPYLAHLTMEPMVSTALVEKDFCHVWAPTQHPDGGAALIAELTGLAPEKVRLDVTFTGGGFGRKFELDAIRQSVQAAMQVPGRPVKVTWTREQDVQHDFYRPAYAARSRVALANGAITGMHSRIAGQSVWRFQGKDQIPYTADPTAAALLIHDIYDFPGKYIDFVEAPWRIPVGLWRSVTLSQNTFFAESAIDEAAIALERDPYEFRRELLAAHPRIIAVLDAAAKAADWYRERPPGHGLGIAVSQGFSSLCVQIAEVVVKDNTLSILKMVCVLDCGLQIDPQTIRAQLEGGMVFGLSAALRGEVTFEKGAVRESNFNDQPILRIHETPEMEIILIDSNAPPGGVGEAGVPPVAAALANAIHAASGRRLRRLPFSSANMTLA